MPLNPRVLLAALLALCATAAGCSKPLAPISRDADATSASAARSGEAGVAGPVRVRLVFVGTVVTLDGAHLPRVERRATYYVDSTIDDSPADTVPAYSRLQRIEWRPASHGSGATQARSRHDAEWTPELAARDSARVFAPGNHELLLQVPPRFGGGTVTVRFVAGFVPTSWWAGPDPALWPPSTDGDGRAVDVTVWRRFATSPAWPPDGRAYFGPDTFRFVPSRRLPVRGDIERRTFYEIYGDRIYARSEGDTVHLNSWIVLVNGGFDKDSPYAPLVDPADPGLPPGYQAFPDFYAALLPQGLIGSPIGFRSRLHVRLPGGMVVRTASSTTYPNFLPASTLRDPHIAGYWQMLYAGKAYVAVQAVDSDGMRQPSTGDADRLADRVDAGGGTPEERLQRRSIVTFHVRP